MSKSTCLTKKILPACVEVCRDATNKLIVPPKYGTVCYWQHQDRFSHSWTTLPAHDHRQEQHECQTNVLCITEQLLDDFKNFKLVLRAKVKDSCGRKFYTNEVLIKVFYLNITKQPDSVSCDSDLCTKKLSIMVDSCPEAVIQWQKRSLLDGPEAPWINIPGANGLSPPKPYEPYDQYRAIVTNFCQQIISNVATIGYVAINELLFDECDDEATLIYEGIPPASVKWVTVGPPRNGIVISTEDTVSRNDLSDQELAAGQKFKGCVYNECEEVCTQELQFSYINCGDPVIDCNTITINPTSVPAGGLTYEWSFDYQTQNNPCVGVLTTPLPPNIMTKIQVEDQIKTDCGVQSVRFDRVVISVTVTNSCGQKCTIDDMRFLSCAVAAYPGCDSTGSKDDILYSLVETNAPYVAYQWWYSQPDPEEPGQDIIAPVPSATPANLTFDDFQTSTESAFNLETKIWVEVRYGFNANDICGTVASEVTSFPRVELNELTCTETQRSSNAALFGWTQTWQEASGEGGVFVDLQVLGNTITNTDVTNCARYRSKLLFTGYDNIQRKVKAGCALYSSAKDPFPYATITEVQYDRCQGIAEIAYTLCPESSYSPSIVWQSRPDDNSAWFLIGGVTGTTFTKDDLDDNQKIWYIRACVVVCGQLDAPGSYQVCQEFDPFYHLQVTYSEVRCDSDSITASFVQPESNYIPATLQWQERSLTGDWTGVSSGGDGQELLFSNLASDTAFVRLTINGTPQDKCTPSYVGPEIAVPYAEFQGVTYDCEGNYKDKIDAYVYPGPAKITVFSSNSENGEYVGGDRNPVNLTEGMWYNIRVGNDCQKGDISQPGDIGYREDTSNNFQYLQSYTDIDLSDWETPYGDDPGTGWTLISGKWQGTNKNQDARSALISTVYTSMSGDNGNVAGVGITVGTQMQVCVQLVSGNPGPIIPINNNMRIEILTANTLQSLKSLVVTNSNLATDLCLSCFEWSQAAAEEGIRVKLTLSAFSGDENGSGIDLFINTITLRCCPPD